MEINKFRTLFITSQLHRLPRYYVALKREFQDTIHKARNYTTRSKSFSISKDHCCNQKESHRVDRQIESLTQSKPSSPAAKTRMPPSIIPFLKTYYHNTLVDSTRDNFLKSDCTVSEDVLSQSADCLKKGGVIAVPTDTVYGVACLAQDTEAINKIYAIKNRNFQNPIAISVAGVEDIPRWSEVTVSEELLHELLPGPVTLVFERKPCLNPSLNPLTNLVGIRIPKNWFMQELPARCSGPIALTSANLSGTKSCLQIEEFENLWPQLDIVVNGGRLNDTEEARLGSTVVDLSVPNVYRIIRPGSANRSTVDCLERFGLKDSTQLSS
ncbi:yrdC domain-containing protein mitochondrial [Biomphalaria pfeifferi]|uniref:Threonylcarbamoyl-AMP synthase n=1 Tax=Biomphalaria pfeifferi TaxID=112525 RepID=A0AAD8FGV1_BIOPF|nr:yrdC domain-containing protein mitochondrial [Biomphalaria pfeifferi]